MTPTTEAGRAMVRMWRDSGWTAENGPEDAVLAVEAEARAAVLAELRAAVKGLPVHYRRNGFASATAWVTRRAVLALLDKAGQP